MMYIEIIYIHIYLSICALFGHVYREKFTLVFIIKLMEFHLKIEITRFRVSDIIATRRVVTLVVSE